MSETFTPQPIKLQGKEYLEVAQRIVWLRQEHPDAQIITAVQEHDRAEGYALLFCTITIPSTGGIGTGWGSASRKDLRGPVASAYLEKAETRAKGRACADLGYGTLAALQEDSDTLADAPQQTQQAQRTQRVEAPRKMEAVETEWSRAADVAIAHMHRLQVSADDEKTLIMELTGGKTRKLIEMHPSEIHRLSAQLEQYRTPADLAALRAPGRAESHGETRPPAETANGTPARISAADKDLIRRAISDLGWGDNDKAAYLLRYGVTYFSELTAEQATVVVPDLEAKARKVQALAHVP